MRIRYNICKKKNHEEQIILDEIKFLALEIKLNLHAKKISNGDFDVFYENKILTI